MPIDPLPNKSVLHFFMLGLLLWLVQHFLLPNTTTTQGSITVSQARMALLTEQWQKNAGRKPGSAELKEMLEAHVREEVLVRTALSRNFTQVDPLIRNRLEMNMRFIGDQDEQPSSPLWQKAISMGMHAQDPVVRRRLVQLVENDIRAGFNPRQPNDDELRSYLLSHSQRYKEIPSLSFKHIFFGNDQSATAQQRALDLLQHLKNNAAKSTRKLGDASLIPTEFTRATLQQVARYLGDPFVTSIAELPTEQWSGPVASPFGWHLVYLYPSTQPSQPDFDLAKGQLIQDWLNEQLKAYQKNAEQEIVKRYDVVLPSQ